MEQLYRVWGCCFAEWFCSSFFLGWVVHSDLSPIQCPSGVIAVSQSFGQVFFFLLQLLVVGAYGFCSVVQSSNNTIFRRSWVMTVPLKILVCVGWLPVY